ncbi:hypothetical protein [Thermosynechococcus sp. FA-CM-4201]
MRGRNSRFLTVREQGRAMQRHLRQSPSQRALAAEALSDDFEKEWI